MFETNNRQIIQQVLTEYHHFLCTYSHLDSQLIVSEDKNDYLIVLSGLHNDKYFHDFVIHIEIREDGIHLLHDQIDIYNKLRSAGLVGGSFTSHCQSKLFGTDFAISLEKIYELHKSFFALETDPKLPVIKANATAEELNELVKIESKYIGSSIALHPNISLDLLLELFSIFPAEVFANSSFEQFMQSETDFSRTLFNACPRIFEYHNLELPVFFIEWALSQKNLRNYVAGTHKVPVRYLEELIDNDDCVLIANLICRIGRPCTNDVPGNYLVPRHLAEKIEAKYEYFQSNCPEEGEYSFCTGTCSDIVSCM